MSASFFDQFDRIAVVSLPNRKDRRRNMRRNLRRVGLATDPRVFFFDAYSVKDRGCFRKASSHGCYLSHLAILKDAGEANQSVLILQDDCHFLPAICDYRVPQGTAIFYGGYSASNPHDLHGSVIIGAHFMGFSASAAKAAAIFLTNLLTPFIPPDSQALAEAGFDPALRPPIDGSLVWFRRAHPEYRTVFKLLGVQASSRSDVTPSHFDRIPLINTLASYYRHFVFRIRDEIAWRSHIKSRRTSSVE